MALPTFTMRQLLEAGVHFGHQTHRWNPKMEPYLFGSRNNIHIIDLAQTVPMLHRALEAVSDTVAQGGRVLFVGTKRQAAEEVAAAARRCAQYYVNARWLGGMLTNWKTISHSIQRLRRVEEILSGETGEAGNLTKKELLRLTRERDKLERSLGGIKDMGGQPDLIFVIDTNKEQIAIQEARRLGIPVAAVLDSNCDPDGITFPVPGNDDAGRAINFYCDMVARAAIDGIGRGQGDIGVDIGESEEPIVEEALADNDTATAAQPTGDFSFETLSAPRGAPDDLKKIAGLGPVMEQKLNDMGIFHYWQVAAFSQQDAARVDEALAVKGRVERDGWIEQAKKLADLEEA
ncbi:30S ribosomal protein S2 [Lutibaculum baratangense]|nr:30S ribosomal protein S2 [Lutibaculum baratangense]